MSESEPRRTYKQEEVTEILKRALKQQSLRNEVLSHEQLVEMAEEVGIDREALEAATTDLAQTRAAELTRETETRELAHERSRLFAKFVSSLLIYLIVNIGLYLLDRRLSGGTWFYWVMLVWGIGLAFQLRNVVFPQNSLLRRKRRERKQELRQIRKAERERQQQRLIETWGGVGPAEVVNSGAKEFEHAVQAGVAALLTVAARKIQEHAGKANDSDRRRRR